MNERGDEIAQSRTELPVKPNCTTPGIFCYCIKGNFKSIYLKKNEHSGYGYWVHIAGIFHIFCFRVPGSK